MKRLELIVFIVTAFFLGLLSATIALYFLGPSSEIVSMKITPMPEEPGPVAPPPPSKGTEL